MSWNAVLGIACILCFFLPVAVILHNRFYTHRSLVALLLYFFVAGSYNLLSEKLIPIRGSLLDGYGLLSNYLDVPLMLTGLLFFCPNRQKQKIVHVLIAAFIGYELTVTCFHGFNQDSVMYIMGPGFAIILCYSTYLFSRQVKFSIMHRKNQGRMLMLASILFAYSCYTLIYYFYFIQKTPYTSDVLLLYYISSSLASTLMAIGLHLMRKRMKELRSLKTTRKELALFFSH